MKILLNLDQSCLCIFQIAIWKENQKLLPSHAPEEIIAADAFHDSLAKSNKNRITDVMPEPVVDILEVVEIQKC
jgi:hypothetical protein